MFISIPCNILHQWSKQIGSLSRLCRMRFYWNDLHVTEGYDDYIVIKGYFFQKSKLDFTSESNASWVRSTFFSFYTKCVDHSFLPRSIILT